MPKVVDPYVVKPGSGTDAAPRLQEMNERGAMVLAQNDTRVVFLTD